MIRNQMKSMQQWVWGLILLTALTIPAQAQQDCEEEFNYTVERAETGGGSSFSFSRDYRMNVIIGQPVIGVTGFELEGNLATYGQLGYYDHEPTGPFTTASEGEYLDRIEVKWEVINDVLAAPVTDALTRIYRNGSLMATVPLSQTTFQDWNVFPGEYYTYEIVTSNEYGESHAQEVIGFLNPNGRITGNVSTQSGSPVSDVKVTLAPNLGRTLSFDGVDDYVFFTDEVLELDSIYTVEGWFRNLEAKEQTIFSALDSATTTPIVKISLTEAGRLQYYHDGNGDGDATILTSKDVYNVDNFERQWHHFAAVYGDETTYLYVNGQRVAEIATPDDDVTKVCQIELGKDGKDLFSGYFQGHLDEFRVWSMERSREDLRKFDDITLIGTETGLQHYWKFDERFGDKIYDYSIKADVEDRVHGYSCDVERTEFLSPVQAGAYTDEGGDYIVAGVYYGSGQTFQVNVEKNTSIGFSMDFDGSDDFISFQNERLPLESTFTIEGWFKVGDHPANDMVLFEATNPENDNLFVQVKMNAAGNMVATYSPDGVPTSLTSALVYDDEFWYHIAFVSDGTDLILYIDGEEIARSSAPSAANSPVASRFAFGRSNPNTIQSGDSYFDGRLDEFRIYDYARTDNQINATMRQVLPLDEFDIAQQEGLLGYWNLGNGQGTFISDLSPNQLNGTFENPQLIQTSGDPVVANWDGADIPLDVEFFSHDFNPNARNVSLDPSVTAVDRVDFQDISQLGVSGFIRYTGTDCFAEGVEIKVNGSSTLPKTYTDEFGKFKVEFEPGSRGQVLTFENGDHTFVPGFIELPRLVRPLAGINIEDNVARTLKGKVIGGICDYPISGAGIGNARVIMSTQPYCYSDTAIVDNTTGAFEFQNAPPQSYVLYVEHENPEIQSYFDLQGAKEVSLVNGDLNNVTFRYRAPVQVEMEEFASNSCGLPVIDQNERVSLDIFVFEDYFGQRCSTPSGKIRIFDDISDRDAQEVEFSNGFASYEIRGGTPNTLSGGSTPYQKKIQVVAFDNELGDLAEDTQFAYVTGVLPGNMDFSTTSPEMPFLILRAPPGDNSVSYIEKGETFSNTMSFGLASDLSQGAFGTAQLGNTVRTSVGLGASKITEVEVTNEYTAEVNYSTRLNSDFEMTQSFTTNERISTTPTNGDVYVGGAMNVLYGAATNMKINPSTCEIILDKEIIMAPDGFATTFIYTEDHILGTIIPELEALGQKTEANSWKGMIMMNHALKERAEFVENITFDAGVEYTKEFTESVSNNFSFQKEVEINASIAQETGVTVDDSGITVGTNTTMQVTMGVGGASSGELTRTVGYTLADDDFGDNFTVNILKDPVYGTPVFELVSGASSCPYEGDIYNYGKGLGDVPTSSLISDLGSELFHKQISQLADVGGSELVDPLVGAVDDVLGIIGLDGLGDAVSDYTDVDAAVELIADELGLNDEAQLRESNRVIDFYLAAFDLVQPETRTLKREGVQMTLEQNVAVDIPVDQEAVFSLNLGNLSQTGESGVYYLTVLQETNPDGAIIKVNGQPLTGNNDISFVLQAGEQVKTTMTVEKGPLAFDYEDITLMFYSSCEREWADARGFNFPEESFSSQQNISVNFIEVCSPINIADPGEDWVISAIDGDRMTVTINEYDLQRPEFSEVKFQYRKDFEGEPWINAEEFLKADLEPGFTIFSWDVALLDDGPYEIRAVSFCDGDIPSRISDILKGVIDRTPPALLGTPTPADAVLGPDDAISIAFTEDIKCDDIISLPVDVSLIQGSTNNVALSNTETGLYMDATVTCEGNTLVIVPEIQNKFIEGQVIRVDVLGMKDELGNEQTETITWEFLVRRNPLEWIGGDVQSTVYEGESPRFIRSIKNNGAFAVNVNLSGELDVQTLDETALPSWITASPRSFTLQPGATQDVTFNISDQISGGEYQGIVAGATSFGAPELRFDVRVLCQEPTWAVNESRFEYSTTITGQLNIRGEMSEDEYDIVAAYVGDELRGVGLVEYAPELAAIPGTHPYLVFMTIYSNSTKLEEIDFKVWDASRCQLYGEVAENYSIGATSISIGSPTNPATITVTNNLVQSVALKQGWNWISFNLNMESSSVNEVLNTLQNADRGAVIKSQNQYSQYVPTLGWVGPLGKIDSTRAYRIKLTADDVLEVRGMPVDFETTKVELDSGWNWVSFLPPLGMEINQALSSLSATADFIVKGQKEFAQYVDFQGWVGSLDFLRPNKGYQVYSDRKQTLIYPVNNANARTMIPDEIVLDLPEGWAVNAHDYEYNANYIVRVDGANVREGDILGLFANERLRGVGVAKYVAFMDAHYFFVTAHGPEDVGSLEAMLARGNDQISFENQSLSFASDQVFGTVASPIVLQSSTVLGAEPVKTTMEVYPNPGDDFTAIRLSMIGTEEVFVQMQNLTGKTIKEMSLGTLSKGEHEITIERTSFGTKVPAGIYLVRVTVGDQIFTQKLIWK
ncbi:MAG: T9SS type A sorting domain-containing protein [Cyclobacteriaceae bacterium]